MDKNTEDSLKVERDWKNMILIAHDFFHKWRQVVEERFGREAMDELTLRFWEKVGNETAGLYRSSGMDPEDLERLVRGIARSSEIMGEKVRMEKEGEKWLLIHDACPWIESYRRSGFPGTCREGCDRWFFTSVEDFSPGFTVETRSSLAAGEKACIRVFAKK